MHPSTPHRSDQSMKIRNINVNISGYGQLNKSKVETPKNRKSSISRESESGRRNITRNYEKIIVFL